MEEFNPNDVERMIKLHRKRKKVKKTLFINKNTARLKRKTTIFLEKILDKHKLD